MGNCASKKSIKSIKISTGKRKIFSSKMEKDQEIHSKGISKKVVPYSKGEITSFGFKKKTISHLPVPVTLTSNSNKVLEAKEKDNNRGASQKNLSEGYQSGSSVESLCHAPFKSTPKVIGKKDARSNQHQQDPIGSGAHVSSGSMKNHSDATMNKFGFRRATPPKPTDLNGRTGPFPVSRTSFLINQGPPDSGCLQGSLRKSDFITRSRSEGPQANFKQSLKSSNSVQSVLNESKSSLTNGTQPKKFTLQTSHLPKPQFPVRIFDTKTAKTAANYYRREGGRAESQTSQIIPISEDSGFESHSSPSNTLEKRIEIIDWSPGSRVRRRLPACKGKKLEMKVVGNKFELLKENEESDSNVVTEISLIKLPPFSTCRSRTGVINTGLVEERTNQYLKRISQPRENSRKELDGAFSNLAKHSSDSSGNGGGSDSSKGLSTESGEEKLFSDNRKSEKVLISEGGSEADDMLLPGEAMADDDSLCLNFEEIIERHRADKRPQQTRFVQEAVETPNTIRLDALKLSKELKYKTFSSFAKNKNSQKVSGKASVIVHLMKGDEEEETFPCDNILEALSSDSDSFGDKGENKNNDKEKNFKMTTINSDTEDLGIEIKELEDDDEEKQESRPSNNGTDVEDDELEINVDETEESRNNSLGTGNSPNCAGTPTHTSNSLSLSDGRDFLIDDEIADQPQLCFSEKYVEIPGADEGKSAVKNKSESVTETCEKQEEVDVAFSQNDKTINKKKGGDEEKGEKFNNRGVRLGSEGTLSPCDSIASDDLMLDFESNSFEETAGRLDLLNNYENIIEEINDEKCTDVPSQIFHPRPIDSGKSPKTGSGNQCPITDGSQTDPCPGRRISQAKPNEDYVKIDKIAYQGVFHDVISMKTMLLNLKCLLSESEEDLEESGRLSLMESNGIADENLKEELTDLRRQVLFLQQQLEEREKVVEVLKTKIKKATTECVERAQCNAATQTGLDRFQQEFPRFRICRITPVV